MDDKREPKESVDLRGRTETILVSEDDEDLRKLTVNTFKAFNYCVIDAKNGQEACRKFVVQQDTIDLIILNAIML